ncbi:bifunctional 2-polyprenyl-6-hydroxyphenol methylase/3-demethylubiquinol 3-O-methyltransferase UbiG [Methylocella sp.]|uniref:bifunctional 2-polyprenyl-6-hydroxyphenol methylase/3-demethylubiquinol 3-O-methyltransferase UbiG n=1 Tax=Methylocella sp. TaxID=1978226 RepID=UPI003783D639
MAAGQAERASSVDAEEVARFDALAQDWWRLDGPMAALHRLNPVRVAHARDLLLRHFGPRAGVSPARPLEGLRLLDAGCGAGLFAEPLARLGASVCAVDPAPANIAAAKVHAEASGLSIDYRCSSVEALAEAGESFDAVFMMEVLEHVRDVAGFVSAAGALARPGGLVVAATLNRTAKSYVLAVVGAEYVLGWAPRGTHDWRKFVTPRELERAFARAGLTAFDETGVIFDPLAGSWRLGRDLAVNYMTAARKEG